MKVQDCTAEVINLDHDAVIKVTKDGYLIAYYMNLQSMLMDIDAATLTLKE